MGNNSSNNLKEQSVLSVSQPRLVATTSSQLLLHAHDQRPKSDTDLFCRKKPAVAPPPDPRLPLALRTRQQNRKTEQVTDTSRELLRRGSSIRRNAGYKARSASLRRQRSILRRNGSLRGKSRAAVRRTIELESELKMAQEQKELCMCAARGDILTVEALVDSGTDVNSVDENQQTALHYAAMHSREEVIDSLIERGADVNATDLKGGFSALHWVVINADPHLHSDHVSKSLKALVNGGCKVNGIDFNFATPLHIAAQKGNKTCIETLIKLGADPDKADITGRSCYDIAKNEEIRQLIKRLQAPKDTHVYHVLEVRPTRPPQSVGPMSKKSDHIYHILEPLPSPPPPPQQTSSKRPPRCNGSTPPPPPPRRRRTQYSQYDLRDTHIYHVLEAPPTTMEQSSLPRRRKTLSRRK